MRTMIAVLTAMIVMASCHPEASAPQGPAAHKRGINLGRQRATITLTTGNNNNVAIRGAVGNTTSLITMTAASGGSTVTGMDATAMDDGDLFWIRNVSTTDNITLTNADSNSLAANRFSTQNASSLVLTPLTSAVVEYDASLGWIVMLAPAGNPTLTAATINGNLTLASTGHLKASSSSTPALSTCGSTPSPSIVSNSTDVAGKYTTGGTATTCTITFATTFTTAPTCIVATEGAATQPTYTVSATAITVTVDIAQTTYNYVCIGR